MSADSSAKRARTTREKIRTGGRTSKSRAVVRGTKETQVSKKNASVTEVQKVAEEQPVLVVADAEVDSTERREVATEKGSGKESSVTKKDKKKKRKTEVEAPSRSVLRIKMTAGYDGKEGNLEHVGCSHMTMSQMRPYAICSRDWKLHYMKSGAFLDGTGCKGCARGAHAIDTQKEKNMVTGAFIYYCHLAVKEGKNCSWYCNGCFEKEAALEERENESNGQKKCPRRAVRGQASK